jgi:hypothetical protein
LKLSLCLSQIYKNEGGREEERKKGLSLVVGTLRSNLLDA